MNILRSRNPLPGLACFHCQSLPCARLNMAPMGVTTCFATAPRANPNLIKMLQERTPCGPLRSHGNKACTLSEPLLHLLIESIVVYF